MKVKEAVSTVIRKVEEMKIGKGMVISAFVMPFSAASVTGRAFPGILQRRDRLCIG